MSLGLKIAIGAAVVVAYVFWRCWTVWNEYTGGRDER